MKKFLILIALLATTAVGNASPTNHSISNLEEWRLLPTEAKALANSATVLDGISLNSVSKYDNNFQADELTDEYYNYVLYEGALYQYEFSSGQPEEIGSATNYYLDYDPVSRWLFGIAANRSGVAGAGNENKVRKRGYVTFGRFESGKKMTQIYRATLYDTTDISPTNTITSPIDVFEWENPTIVAANPLESETLSGLKFAVSMKTDVISKNTPSTTGRLTRYNTISLFNGSALFTNDLTLAFKDSVSYDYLDSPLRNPATDYSFARGLKGHKAYFNDENGKRTPFAIFFGPVYNSAAPFSNNFKFGLLSLRLDNIPNRGQNDIYDNIHRFQFLSPNIENLLGGGIRVADATLEHTDRGFNLDYDDSNNLYLGLFETKKEHVEDSQRGNEFKRLRVPMVIKTKYNFNTTEVDPARNGDIIGDDFKLDTMPFSVLQDYITSFEGEVTTEEGEVFKTKGICVPNDDNTCPKWWWLGMNIRAELPFVVTAEDQYSFIVPLYFACSYGDKGQLAYEQQLSEITKDENGWRIKKIADIYNASWDEGYPVPLGYFYYSTTTGRTTLWNHIRGNSSASDAGTGYVMNPEVQISRTADKQYVIAKWQDCLPHEYVRLTEPISFYNSSEELMTVDSFFVPSLYLSYRHVDSVNWSTPIRASHLNYPDDPADWDANRDTVTIMGSYMPRVVPDLDNVIMSVSQYQMQDGDPGQAMFADKIVKTRVRQYAVHNIIAPSARTGRQITGIEEGEPATMDHLAAAYPNPTSNTVNFSFSLLKPANTTLIISNSLGQEVAVVVNQFCNASDYSVEYNTTRLPVGVYYFTLSSGDIRQTKMFTIAR